MNTARPQTAPRITDERLQRLCLWLALTVAWFAAHVLGAVAPEDPLKRAAAVLLAQHGRIARNLLALRAVRRIGFKAPRRTSVPVDIRRLTARGVAGVALRRALRRHTLAGRTRALCALLAESERWIAHIARRLKRGFTKLRALPRPRRAHLRSIASAPLTAPHAAVALNSS
jgi:hypothetical protein